MIVIYFNWECIFHNLRHEAKKIMIIVWNFYYVSFVKLTHEHKNVQLQFLFCVVFFVYTFLSFLDSFVRIHFSTPDHIHKLLHQSGIKITAKDSLRQIHRKSNLLWMCVQHVLNKTEREQLWKQRWSAFD